MRGSAKGFVETVLKIERKLQAKGLANIVTMIETKLPSAPLQYK